MKEEEKNEEKIEKEVEKIEETQADQPKKEPPLEPIYVITIKAFNNQRIQIDFDFPDNMPEIQRKQISQSILQNAADGLKQENTLEYIKMALGIGQNKSNIIVPPFSVPKE